MDISSRAENPDPANPSFSKKTANKKKKSWPVHFYVGTGVDYSQNAFEVIALEQDSLFREKITSPAIRGGLNLKLDSQGIPVTIKSSFTYDRIISNLTNEMQFHMFSDGLPEIRLYSNRIVSNDTSNYNFWENKVELLQGWSFGNWRLDLITYYRNKNYDRQTEVNRNYYSVYFSVDVNKYELQSSGTKSFSAEYYANKKLDYNDFESYWYFQWKHPSVWKSGTIDLTVAYLKGSYHYIYTDQILQNTYMDFIFNFDIKQHLWSHYWLHWKSESFIRTYSLQNEYENNFYYWKEKIGPEYQFLDRTNQIGIYYIDEVEKHYTSADSFNVDDYHSRGVGLNLFIMIHSINLLFEYEYFDKKTNSPFFDFISYNQPSSNHNLIASFSWRITPRWNLNANISFLHTRNLREKNYFLTNYMTVELLYSF